MHTIKNEPPVMFHLKSVAKIALSVGLIASVALLAVIFLVTDENGADYARNISSRSVTKESLGAAMFVFGLSIVALASVSTWLITLYSSFRIAGPLFRFSQNLRSIIEDAFALPVAIRRTDMLQQQWNEFDASQERLREHYRSLSEALEQCVQTLEKNADADNGELGQKLAHLLEVERRVQL